MGQIRDMRELHPAMLPLAAEWLRRCAARTIPVLVVETRRTMEVAAAYYARSREPLEAVNALYLAAGLAPITATDNLKQITKAKPGQSYHNWGLALDAVPFVDGKPDWTYNPEDPKDLYDEMAAEAKGLGLEWGGDWRTFKDLPHIQYPVKLDFDALIARYSETHEWRVELA